MKNVSKLYYFLLLILFLLPNIKVGTAQSSPKYVGIGSSNKDYYIWSTAFDKSPYEAFLEDAGYTDDEVDNITDHMFDDEFDENVIEWRLLIGEIEKEKEVSDISYVKVHYSLYYEKENGQQGYDADIKEIIYEYDKDLYMFLVWYDMGLFDLFIAKDVNWNRVVRNVNDKWEDEWDGDDQKGSADVEKSWFYFTEKANGISTLWNPDDEVYEDFGSTSIYNDDGVLAYYEWTYDGEPIWKLELKYRFADEYWWIFVLIAIAATAVLVILSVTVIHKKKLMTGILAGCVIIVIVLIIGQGVMVHNLYYFLR
ncbi:MAG: hypothetical protein ACFFCM_08025 [Promethearchaeota archaeon]